MKETAAKRAIAWGHESLVDMSELSNVKIRTLYHWYEADPYKFDCMAVGSLALSKNTKYKKQLKQLNEDKS